MEETVKRRADRGVAVNSMTMEELVVVVEYMRKNTIRGSNLPFIEKTDRGEKCNLKTTKTAKGDPKYPQIDLKPLPCSLQNKQLVHLIYWRFINNGALIDPDLTISHLDKDPTILDLRQESWAMNESRKYCHMFGWYKTLPHEERARCPHWENPCTGPP